MTGPRTIVPDKAAARQRATGRADNSAKLPSGKGYGLLVVQPASQGQLFLLRPHQAPTRNLLGKRRLPIRRSQLSKLCATLDSSRSLRIDRRDYQNPPCKLAALTGKAGLVVRSKIGSSCRLSDESCIFVSRSSRYAAKSCKLRDAPGADGVPQKCVEKLCLGFSPLLQDSHLVAIASDEIAKGDGLKHLGVFWKITPVSFDLHQPRPFESVLAKGEGLGERAHVLSSDTSLICLGDTGWKPSFIFLSGTRLGPTGNDRLLREPNASGETEPG